MCVCRVTTDPGRDCRRKAVCSFKFRVLAGGKKGGGEDILDEHAYQGLGRNHEAKSEKSRIWIKEDTS